MNWTEIPDLTAVALLICAFASVARRSPTLVSGIWLTGWVMIAFTSPRFSSSPFQVFGNSGSDHRNRRTPMGWLSLHVGIGSLPHGDFVEHLDAGGLMGTNTIYIALISIDHPAPWALKLAAGLVALCRCSLGLFL